jgi:hypothetical protein
MLFKIKYGLFLTFNCNQVLVEEFGEYPDWGMFSDWQAIFDVRLVNMTKDLGTTYWIWSYEVW